MVEVCLLNTRCAACMYEGVRVCGTILLSFSSLSKVELCRLLQLLSITAAVGSIYSDKEGRRKESPLLRSRAKSPV